MPAAIAIATASYRGSELVVDEGDGQFQLPRVAECTDLQELLALRGDVVDPGRLRTRKRVTECN